jgi:hypothetical protein
MCSYMIEASMDVPLLLQIWDSFVVKESMYVMLISSTQCSIPSDLQEFLGRSGERICPFGKHCKDCVLCSQKPVSSSLGPYTVDHKERSQLQRYSRKCTHASCSPDMICMYLLSSSNPNPNPQIRCLRTMMCIGARGVH